MSYTVIARRWRPKTLDEVVGQRHVTQTLRNAMASGRIAQAFVFAPGAALSDIVDAINRVGASPADLVAILEALKQAGALKAELVII